MASPTEAPPTPEGSDGQEDSLTADLNDQDEDSSLLDTALGLGEATEGDGEPPETPTEEQVDNLLDDSADTVPIEEDPVRFMKLCLFECGCVLIKAHHPCFTYFRYYQEIEAIKARVKEMEEEAEKLKEMQGEVEKQMMSTKTGK